MLRSFSSKRHQLSLSYGTCHSFHDTLFYAALRSSIRNVTFFYAMLRFHSSLLSIRYILIGAIQPLSDDVTASRDREQGRRSHDHCAKVRCREVGGSCEVEE